MAEGDDSDSRNQHRLDWEEICLDLMPRLAKRALRLTDGRVPDAEDLTQETICRALIYPKNAGEIRSPLSYLMRMMRNAWIDKWREEDTANMDSLDAILNDPARQAEVPTVEPEILRLAENEGLLQELKLRQGPLSTEEKFLLDSYLAGQTLDEIATSLNEDVRVTKVRWNALKSKLRYRLRGGQQEPKGPRH